MHFLDPSQFCERAENWRTMTCLRSWARLLLCVGSAGAFSSHSGRLIKLSRRLPPNLEQQHHHHLSEWRLPPDAKRLAPFSAVDTAAEEEAAGGLDTALRFGVLLSVPLVWGTYAPAVRLTTL